MKKKGILVKKEDAFIALFIKKISVLVTESVRKYVDSKKLAVKSLI